MPKDPTMIPFFVLGNKIDLVEERQVQQDQVDMFLKSNPEFIYYETSAMDGSNIKEVFTTVA